MNVPVSTIASGVMAVLLLTGAQQAHARFDASRLGDLFLTVAQRQAIDARRQGKPAMKTPQNTDTEIRLKGFVQRSDGKNVIWVNDENTMKPSRLPNVKVHANTINRKKQVGLSVDGRWLRLKPGEKWTSGKP